MARIETLNSSNNNYVDGNQPGDDNEDAAIFGLGGDDTLTAYIGFDTLFGGDGDDRFQYGTASTDDFAWIIGGTGNNTLFAASAAGTSVSINLSQTTQRSFVVGGTTYVYDYSTLKVDNVDQAYVTEVANINGGDGNDSFVGNDLANNFFGDQGNDYLNGGAGDDTLDGGIGVDSLYGGTGNDIIRTGSGDGGDLVYAGDGNDDVTVGGNTATVHGEGGDDYIHSESNASSFADTFNGNDGNDTLDSQAGDDTLNGGVGNDLLIGGAGGDSMIGGAGNDTFVIDADDTLVEFASGGTDEVRTGATEYTLLSYFENLLLSSTDPNGSIGTGNDANNVITGSSGKNTLYGMDGDDNLWGLNGNDTLYGGDGNDALEGGGGVDEMVGGAGNDSYTVDSQYDVVTEVSGGGNADMIATSINVAGNYILPDYVEHLTLIGSALNGTGNSVGNEIRGNDLGNNLNGGSGNGWDSLYGGAGNDTMAGGGGNDLYSVEDAGDVIAEAANGGTDTLDLWATYTLANNISIENISVNFNINTGAAITYTGNTNSEFIAINAIGNGTSVRGGGGADTISGSTYAESINGGLGNDYLIGWGGADQFIFNSALNGTSNVDVIEDFVSATDRIQLENTGTGLFNALTATGTLTAAAFWSNTTGMAHDADDRIIYNTTTGDLYYDADGTGAAARIKFATIQNLASLTASDFLVI